METVDNVVSLVSATRAENGSGENVISRLQEALALANAGKVQNVIIIMATDDNDIAVQNGWANADRPFEMLGALEVTKLEFLNATIERQVHW